MLAFCPPVSERFGDFGALARGLRRFAIPKFEDAQEKLLGCKKVIRAAKLMRDLRLDKDPRLATLVSKWVPDAYLQEVFNILGEIVPLYPFLYDNWLEGDEGDLWLIPEGMYFGGMSYDEIGEFLGNPEGTNGKDSLMVFFKALDTGLGDWEALNTIFGWGVPDGPVWRPGFDGQKFIDTVRERFGKYYAATLDIAVDCIDNLYFLYDFENEEPFEFTAENFRLFKKEYREAQRMTKMVDRAQAHADRHPEVYGELMEIFRSCYGEAAA